jgi:RHS repeat-associated protein
VTVVFKLPLRKRLPFDFAHGRLIPFLFVDVAGGLAVILLEIDPADSLIKKSYYYANGEILMQQNGNHTADKYFYLHDRLGSVREVINTSGSVVHHYTYGPFGQTIESSHESQAPSNEFMFTGQWYDPEIGQYYLRARMYDPQLIRFTAYDPVTGKFEEPMTLHKYLYCLNAPINRADPSGLLYFDLNYTYSAGTGVGALRGGVYGALAGSMACTAGMMYGTSNERSSATDFYYFGGGINLSAKGGNTFTLTASPDQVATGWNFALTGISPGGLVLQGGWSGEFSKGFSSFYDELNYEAFEWFEVGTKLGGKVAPQRIMKALRERGGPKYWTPPGPSDLDPRAWLNNASVSLTGFYVFDWDVYGGDWIDRSFAAGEMFGNKPVSLGANTLNVMFSEFLDFDRFGQ